MKDTDYLSLSARIRVLENRLLTAERRERMIDAATDDEAVKVITECGYDQPENASAGAVDAALTKARLELFADLKKSSPQPGLVEVFEIKYDYHNAKTLLKAAAMGEEAGHLLMRGGRYPIPTVTEAVSKNAWEGLSAAFQTAVDAARDALGENDPQLADVILDKACYAEMAQAAHECASPFLEGYVRLSVDAANLRAAVRCARMGLEPAQLEGCLIPGGTVDVAALAKSADVAQSFKNTPLARAAEVGASLTAPGSGSLTEFERLCDNALTGYLAQAKRVPFGEQPVVGYLCAREAEATTVRTILALRSAGLSGDAIRERLRDSYV